jgi:peptide/nickel transport system ATP-binding protein
MQRGRIVEQGPAAEVLNRPQHPYTKSLIAAVPHGAAPGRAVIATAPVLELRQVEKTYRRGGLFGARTVVRAVHDADFTLRRGETLGLVGESGSGKSTLARCVVKLVEPERGTISYRGTDLRPLSRAAWKPYRRRIQMVFQDPYASLNPRRTVGEIIAEGPVTHGVPRAKALERARELLRLVQLDAGAMDRYPHEFSGGQRQRIGIARALAMEPELLIADEPVSALDVSVQAQVLALLAEIRARLGLTMLFITHDLRVAAQICDRVAVMQRGAIVEQGPTAEVFAAPQHPYTRQLLDSIPGRGWTPPEL